MAVVHGGNVYEIASNLGCPPESILDFSASINPLGPPPGLLEQFQWYYPRLQHYPDIHNRELYEALSLFHDVGSERIVAGNGSTELLYWLPKALGVHRALVALPTFGEYPKAFELQGVKVARLQAHAEHHFQPTVEQLDEAVAAEGPEAVLVTHPGSPGGDVLAPDVKDWLIETGRSKGLFCIVDEVFVDFCEDESLKGFLAEAPRLVLIRSMTKFYGIPGLRLGYVLASPEAAEPLRRALPPWSVNTLAQIAGSYCLGQTAYREETLRLVEAERSRISAVLQDLPGVTPFPGRANYLLVQLHHSLPSARTLQQDLLRSHRILVRDCKSFDGLGERFVRIAVRLPQDNDRLLDGLSKWVRSRGSPEMIVDG